MSGPRIGREGDIEIHGLCEERYLPVKEAFAENFRQGLETGASLAITEGGRYVLDLWAGYANYRRTRAWEEDTIVMVFSTTKIMTVLCALMLVDRGQLDVDAPVARYWPEFAAGGKEDLPVRYVFAHSAGLPGFDEKIPFEALLDWDRIVGMLARQRPWWEPGTVSGYHVFTLGFLLGELVRRISGRSLGQFFRTEVAERIGADFHIGLPREHRPRVAGLTATDQRVFEQFEPDSMTRRVFENPPAGDWTSGACQSAEIPSVNGHGNARSVARVGSVLAMGGELEGVRLLSRATLERAAEEQSYGTDLVLAQPVRLGLGLGLHSDEFPFPNPNTLHWGGYGGSFCMMDMDTGLCCAYAMNHLRPEIEGDPRNESITQALFEVMRSAQGGQGSG